MTAEHDLLTSIFSADAVYPWQPLETEGYLTQLEAEFDALVDDELDTAIAAGWQTLSAQITDLAPSTNEGNLAQPDGAILDQIRQFQDRLPIGLLQSLAISATALARSGQPLIDQLVTCVHDLLPAWDAADLGVLARPLAYSLRDGRGEIVDLNLRAIPTTTWDNLSDVDQARLTLAIASVALKAAEAGDRGTEGQA
jgi:hypothetical protein